jgi:signal transduction histidine kinase
MTKEERDQIGDIVHELNNALGLVISYATLLSRDVADRPGALDDLAEIRNAGESAAQLVAQLSAVLRTGQGDE